MQDTRSVHKGQLCFYTQEMNNPKIKLKNNSLYNSIKIIKFIGIILTIVKYLKKKL